MQQAPGETLLLQEQKACAGSYSVLLKAEALALRHHRSGRHFGSQSGPLAVAYAAESVLRITEVRDRTPSDDGYPFRFSV